MKKAIPAVILALCLVLCLTGCRRRIMVNAEQIVYETTQSRQDTEPTQPEQEETVPETKEAMPVTQTEDSHREEPQIVQTPGSPDGGTTPVQATEPTQPPEAKEITVTLRPNRGQCDVESLTVTVGEPYGQLPVATRPGYTFTGWYAASNGGRQITAETLVTNSENHSLYAHWAARGGYGVIFDPNGGWITSGEAERTVYLGDPWGDLPTAARSGYDFTGWFTQDGAQIHPEDVFQADGNVTVYAGWAYNPYAYWSFRLQNITQQVYACQQVSVYWEYAQDGITTGYCPLLADTGSYNVAQNLSDYHVTDDWVLGKKPNVIVKCTDSAGAYDAMAARFPGCRILIVPTAAVYGTDSQRLYYSLYFGKLLYPDWYADVDLLTVGTELGVSGTIWP